MDDPDSWPIILALAAHLILAFGLMYTGVLVENSSQKEAAKSGVGLSMHTVAALLFSLFFGIWGQVNLFAVVRRLAALTLPPQDPNSISPVYYLVLILAGLVVETLVLMLFVLLPLSWGRARSDRYERALRFMKPFVALFLPLARLATMPARRLLHARGVASEVGSVTEEDVLELVDSVEGSNYIDETQKEMIGNIFDLDDVTAADIMTHRTEVEAVPVTATADDVIALAVEHGYSRLPVYDGSLDNITGIACVKDLLPYVGKGTQNIDLNKLWRPTLFVPESRLARDLLFDFKQKKIQLAVVVDEYGGTAGIVTMEDILESIVGDIEDEYDEEDFYIVENPDGSLTCDGYADVDDVFEALGFEEAPEEIETDTIGGLLTGLLARIPKKGEQPAARYGEVELTALDADERRILSVLVRRVTDEQQEEPLSS